MFHKNNFFLFGLALDYIAHTTTQNGRNIHTKLLYFSINNNTAVTNVMSFADEWSAFTSLTSNQEVVGIPFIKTPLPHPCH